MEKNHRTDREQIIYRKGGRGIFQGGTEKEPGRRPSEEGGEFLPAFHLTLYQLSSELETWKERKESVATSEQRQHQGIKTTSTDDETDRKSRGTKD